MNHPETLNKIYVLAKKRPISVSDASYAADVNSRFAREVVGLMTAQGLLIENPETMEYTANPDVTAQQVQELVDKMTASYPEKKKSTKETDATFAKKASSPRPKKVKNETGKCLCGCGANSTSNYRPGHDARHAGQVARLIESEGRTKAKRAALLKQLPSDKLRAKAEKMADARLAKAESAAKKEAAK